MGIERKSGTGKELIAHAIHQRVREERIILFLLTVQASRKICSRASSSDTSEGLFTGAETKKTRSIVLANSGTLFLDEIGDCLCRSAKLLRVLETKQVVPVGGHRHVPANFRLSSNNNSERVELEQEKFGGEQLKATLLITIVFILTVGFQPVVISSDTTIKKELPAVKTDQLPTIDGGLDDVCWQDAPQAINFTDERTEKPAKNQSVVRLVYTDEAIYVGIHLYDDMPDKIVARQTKDQTRIRGEDSVSFSLDPFHTHQFSDRNFFIVNPLGTKFARLATGRAEKSEWIGLWKAAAQVVKDGWIVELEIPWQMLDYPDTREPIRMGINVDRWQQRTGEKSWWCNLGVNEFRENDGHWIDVLPPPRKRELKLLPYLIGGIAKRK